MASSSSSQLVFYKRGGFEASLAGVASNMIDGDRTSLTHPYKATPAPRERRPPLTKQQKAEIRIKQKQEMTTIETERRRSNTAAANKLSNKSTPSSSAMDITPAKIQKIATTSSSSFSSSSSSTVAPLRNFGEVEVTVISDDEKEDGNEQISIGNPFLLPPQNAVTTLQTKSYIPDDGEDEDDVFAAMLAEIEEERAVENAKLKAFGIRTPTTSFVSTTDGSGNQQVEEEPEIWTHKPVERIISIEDKLFLHHDHTKELNRESILFGDSIQMLIMQQHWQAYIWKQTCKTVPQENLMIIRTNARQLAVVDTSQLTEKHWRRIRWLGRELVHGNNNPGNHNHSTPNVRDSFCFSGYHMKLALEANSPNIRPWPSEMNDPEMKKRIYESPCRYTLDGKAMEMQRLRYDASFWKMWFANFPTCVKHAVESKTSLVADGAIKQRQKMYQKKNEEQFIKKHGYAPPSAKKTAAHDSAKMSAGSLPPGHKFADNLVNLNFMSSSGTNGAKTSSSTSPSSATAKKSTSSADGTSGGILQSIFRADDKWCTAEGLKPSTNMHLSEFWWTPIFGPLPPVKKEKKKIGMRRKRSTAWSASTSIYQVPSPENIPENWMHEMVDEMGDYDEEVGALAVGIETLDYSARDGMESLPGTLATFGLLVGADYAIPTACFDPTYFAHEGSDVVKETSSSAMLTEEEENKLNGGADEEEEEHEKNGIITIDDDDDDIDTPTTTTLSRGKNKKKTPKVKKQTASNQRLKKSITSCSHAHQQVALASCYAYATYALASTGIDKPTLTDCIEANGKKDNQQAKGRGQRWFPAKQDSTFLEFVDSYSMYPSVARRHDRANKMEGAIPKYYRIERKKKT